MIEESQNLCKLISDESLKHRMEHQIEACCRTNLAYLEIVKTSLFTLGYQIDQTDLTTIIINCDTNGQLKLIN